MKRKYPSMPKRFEGEWFDDIHVSKLERHLMEKVNHLINYVECLERKLESLERS